MPATPTRSDVTAPACTTAHTTADRRQTGTVHPMTTRRTTSSRSQRTPHAVFTAVAALAGVPLDTFTGAAASTTELMQALAASDTPLDPVTQATILLASLDPAQDLTSSTVDDDASTRKVTRPEVYDYPPHTRARDLLAQRADLHPAVADALAMDRYDRVLTGIACNPAVSPLANAQAASALHTPTALVAAATGGTPTTLTTLAAKAAHKPRATSRRFELFSDRRRPQDCTRWEQTLAALVANPAVTGELRETVTAACMRHLDADYAHVTAEYTDAYSGRDSVVWDALFVHLSQDPRHLNELALTTRHPWLLRSAAWRGDAPPHVLLAALEQILPELTTQPDKTSTAPHADLLTRIIIFTYTFEARLGRREPAQWSGELARVHRCATSAPAASDETSDADSGPTCHEPLDPFEVEELRRAVDKACAAARRWRPDGHIYLREALRGPRRADTDAGAVDALFRTGHPAEVVALVSNDRREHVRVSLDAVTAFLTRRDVTTEQALVVAGQYHRHSPERVIEIRSFDRDFRLKVLAGAPGRQNIVEAVDDLLALIPMWRDPAVIAHTSPDIVSQAVLDKLGERLLELPWVLASQYLGKVPSAQASATRLLTEALSQPGAVQLLAQLSHESSMSLLELTQSLGILAAQPAAS